MNATKTAKRTTEDIDDFPAPEVDLPEKRPAGTTLALNVEITDPALVFVENGAQPLIDMIREKVSTLVLDISSAAGRREMASVARKIASSKTYIDDVGKKFVSELKAKSKIIDAERKRVCDTLDELKEEVRRPLTEWENKDQRRIDEHKAAIDAIGNLNQTLDLPASSREIDERICMLIPYRQRDWEEFETMAGKVIANVEHNLKNKLAAAIEAEEERAELARLRREAQERRDREREEMIRRQAAEEAREKAERIARIEHKKLEDARILAEARAAKAEQDRDLAAMLEKQRIANEKMLEERAIAERQADVEHRAKIDSEIEDAMGNMGFDSHDVLAIIKSINSGKIPHITINY